MQIELIGCTGAGKSTLAREMVQVCRRQGLDVVLAEELVLRQLRLHWITSPPLRKLLINLAGFSASVITWRNSGQLGRFATRTLLQLPISQMERVALLRNVLKKVGVAQIIRARRREWQIVVMDEGVLQIAHNLFVHLSAAPPMEAIAAFVRLAPMPDVVVYVRPEESVLIARTLQRGHSRIAHLSDDNVTRFISRAVATFDRLAQEPAVQRRLLVVDGAQRITTLARDGDDPSLALASALIPSAQQYAA